MGKGLVSLVLFGALTSGCATSREYPLLRDQQGNVLEVSESVKIAEGVLSKEGYSISERKIRKNGGFLRGKFRILDLRGRSYYADRSSTEYKSDVSVNMTRNANDCFDVSCLNSMEEVETTPTSLTIRAGVLRDFDTERKVLDGIEEEYNLRKGIKKRGY